MAKPNTGLANLIPTRTAPRPVPAPEAPPQVFDTQSGAPPVSRAALRRS